MNRITKKLSDLKKQNKKALVCFITAGDPTLADTEKLVLTLEKAGVDIIELGVPFSDPMADGPVIQLASERALKKGVDLQKILNLVKKLRASTQIPILLMGYYNPILAMGEKTFAQKAKESGVDAALIVDLPPEEATTLDEVLKQNGLEQIFLLAPTSSPDRINAVVKKAGGFIYYVSITGITGAKSSVNTELKKQINAIRKKTKLPLMIGFGISTPEQARHFSEIGDGVVVGSSLVKLIHETRANQKKVFKYVRSLKEAI